MDTEIPETTAQQRLESTRRAIAGQLARRRGGSIHTEQEVFVEDATAPAPGLLPNARRAAKAWWQSHPVHDAIDLARPALEDYAHRKPYQLVGIAAGTGVALTLLKSLRVLPLTTLAVALLKSSDLKSTARSFVRSQSQSSSRHS